MAAQGEIVRQAGHPQLRLRILITLKVERV